MLQPRLAEMDLAVDHPRQDMEPACVDGLACDAFGDVADGGDAAIPDADIGKPFARVIDEGAAFENEVEGFSQGAAQALLRANPRFNSFIASGRLGSRRT